MPPNIALFAWPVVVIVIFSCLPRRAALVWSLLAGYLLLPESFSIDLRLLPPIDKGSVGIVGLIIGVFLFKDKAGLRSPATAPNLKGLINDRPLFGKLIMALLVLMVVRALLTIATNTAPFFTGARYLPGLIPWDMVNMGVQTAIVVVPFFLGRHFLATPADHRFLLRCLVIAGLLYSVLVLIEMRLSPQMNNWVYGYHQHSFAQHVRGGYYRPKVFLQHGLWVGLFLFMVVMAAGALGRDKTAPGRRKWLLIGGYMMVILLFSRNLGALTIAFVLLPLLWAGTLWQARVACLLAVLFVTYPAVRQANLVPLDQITAFAGRYSDERARSFAFRVRNEDQLLERAREKPLFGWGGWGRSRVYNENGSDISVTDGIWIIVLGSAGWVGYIAFFGLLSAPLIALPRVARRRPIPPETAAMALIMAGNLIYLVPNSALSPVGWLMTGALAGFVQFAPRRATEPDTGDAAIVDAPRHTRFPPVERPRRPVAATSQYRRSSGKSQSSATSTP